MTRYELTYEYSPSSNRSLLKTLTQYDAADNPLTTKPVTLYWTAQNRSAEREQLTSLALTDLDGDGLNLQ